ncbi:MAG: SHOCT domain-containing protein [Gammaproteobacteria bacterium]|nr:SHOCT domain-containing protein [Gammaproteobacteria bacterium]
MAWTGMGRFFAAALMTAVLTVACGGESTKVQQNTTTTMGRELIDLKESHDRGIITDEEYKKAKKEIMKRYE